MRQIDKQAKAYTFAGGGNPPATPLSDSLLGCLSIKKWAHDKFKLSIYPQPKLNKRRYRYPAQRLACIQQKWKRDYGCDMSRSFAFREKLKALKAEVASSLDSSSEFQEGAKLISGYGGLPTRKIFRRTAADRISEVGWYGWKKYGGKGVILTGTRPGSLDEGEKVFASYSGQIIANIRQWIRDVCGISSSVFFVWEPHKSGQLHCHLAVITESSESLKKLVDGWSSKWFGELQKVSVESGVDLFRKNEFCTWKNSPEFWQSDAQFLRKNPANYFVKYLTKGVRELARKVAYCPSRWWGVDRASAQSCDKERVRMVLSGATMGDIRQSLAKMVQVLKDKAPKIEFYVNPKFPEFGGVVAFVPEQDWLNCLLKFSQICSQERLNYANS